MKYLISAFTIASIVVVVLLLQPVERVVSQPPIVIPVPADPAAPQRAQDRVDNAGNAGNAEQQYSTFNAVQIASQDITTLVALGDSSLDPQFMRYMSLHNFPAAQRAGVIENVNFVLNSLNSGYRRIVHRLREFEGPGDAERGPRHV